MRIVYLNKVDVNSPLPAVNFTLFNAHALAQAGAESHLFVQKSLAGFDENMLFTQFDMPPLPNFHLHVYAQERLWGLKTNQWFYLKVYNAIVRQHRQAKIDAVISRDPGALPYLARLRRKHGIAAFYQPHNYYADLSVRPDVNPTNARKYQWLEKKFIPQVSGLLCLQDSQAGWYRRSFPAQKILVAKPGLMRMAPPADDRFSKRVIGYIGSLQLKKGIEVLLQALVLLKEENVRLLLVGGRNEAEIEPVRQRIRDLDLNDLVEITGWVPFAQVQSCMQRIGVGVVPLQDTFYNRYLTAPNKLFDYLSRGIPIIAADLPAIRDFLTDGVNVRLFPPERPEALAGAISDLFASRERYDRLQRASLQAAEDYRWDRRAQVMLDLIRDPAGA